MHLCVMGIDFISFYDFSTGFLKCSDSVVFFAFPFILESPTVIMEYFLNIEFRSLSICNMCQTVHKFV